jgi:mannonate dehydratase
MKLGFGLYRHQLDDAHLAFARQCGATHLVVHWVDYFRNADAHNARGDQPTGAPGGVWGDAGDPDNLWDESELIALRHRVEAAGLVLAAIENFDPAHWFDILLDGPRRDMQVEGIRETIRRVGRAGIPVIGYNFSLAGVYGRVKSRAARGGAIVLGMDGRVDEEPIPDGVAWNMRLPAGSGATSVRARVDSATIWSRLARFLRDVVPAAEEAGVRLAAHPDDPPVERLRDTPRLVNRPDLFRRLCDLVPSRSNALELCLGTLAEMPGENFYEILDEHARRGEIAYIHLRNVRGQVPHYRETFLDEGDIDVARVVRILREGGFDGVIIPDHTPQMSCAAPWHAGMAFAMGYLKALLDQDPGKRLASDPL